MAKTFQRNNSIKRKNQVQMIVKVMNSVC